MRTRISAERIQGDLVTEVQAISGENLFACNQCGKCSAGCPLSFQMDILPNQVIRLLQLGLEESLDSQAIWICAACLTCVTRCPKGIDLPRIMEALRLIQMQRSGARLEVDEISPAQMGELPQIAVVSGFRKYHS
jgi:heterodisulfide reductase subunit C